eukprot:EG_transcript_25207
MPGRPAPLRAVAAVLLALAALGLLLWWWAEAAVAAAVEAPQLWAVRSGAQQRIAIAAKPGAAQYRRSFGSQSAIHVPQPWAMNSRTEASPQPLLLLSVSLWAGTAAAAAWAALAVRCTRRPAAPARSMALLPMTGLWAIPDTAPKKPTKLTPAAKVRAADRKARSVFLCGLPRSTTKQDLARRFPRAEEITMKTRPRRGFDGRVFLVFPTAAEARALAANTLVLRVNGKRVAAGMAGTEKEVYAQEIA